MESSLKIISTLIFISVLSGSSGLAQTTFQKTYGNAYGNEGNSVSLSSSGGYLVGGWYDLSGLFSSEFYLISTDVFGDTLWVKTYGKEIDSAAGRNGSGNQGYCAIQTADNGIFFVGEVHGFGAGVSDVYALRLDAQGDTLWSRVVGTIESDYGQSVIETSDGNFVVAGFTESPSIDIRDAYLVCFDSIGNLLWTKTFGGSSIDAVSEIKQTNDGGYILVGYTFSFGASSSNVYVIKTAASGNIQWQKSYGGSTNDYGYSIFATDDEGYIIAGATESFGAGLEDVLLIKVDSVGNASWSKVYGGEAFDSGNSVEQTSDMGYIITGYTRSFGAGEEDVYLIKTDSNGDTLWTRTYGGLGEDIGKSVKQAADGGYVIGGYTRSFGAGNSDVYLIKVDGSGNGECHQYNTTTVIEEAAIATNNVVSVVGSSGKLGQPITQIGYTASSLLNACDIEVGISSETQTPIDLVYPIPATDLVSIKWANGIGKSTIVMIYDLSGVQLMSQTLSGDQLNISSLPSGVFILRLETNTNAVTTRLIKM